MRHWDCRPCDDKETDRIHWPELPSAQPDAGYSALPRFGVLQGAAAPSGLPLGLSSEESACSAGDMGSMPGSGRFPGGRHGNPLQHACLGNPMERGACQATVYGVTEEPDETARLNTNKLLLHLYKYYGMEWNYPQCTQRAPGKCLLSSYKTKMGLEELKTKYLLISFSQWEGRKDHSPPPPTENSGSASVRCFLFTEK